MRPCLGVHLTRRRLLDAVVADCRSGTESLLDIARFEVSLIRVRPDAGEAIGLEFLANGKVVPTARILLGHLLDLIRDAELGLDVMAELVRDDVGHREVAAFRAEARLELVHEAEVEVDLLVGRAIEGPGRRRRRATIGLRAAVEQDELRLGVVAVGLAEGRRPEGLDVAHDVGKLLVRVALRVERAAGLGRPAAREAPHTGDRATTAKDAAEQQEQDDDHDDPAQAAAGLARDRDRDGGAATAARRESERGTAALSAAILDLIESRIPLPFHDDGASSAPPAGYGSRITSGLADAATGLATASSRHYGARKHATQFRQASSSRRPFDTSKTSPWIARRPRSGCSRRIAIWRLRFVSRSVKLPYATPLLSARPPLSSRTRTRSASSSRS